MAGPNSGTPNRFGRLFSPVQGQGDNLVNTNDVEETVIGRLRKIEGNVGKMAAISSNGAIQKAQETIRECRRTISSVLQAEIPTQKATTSVDDAAVESNEEYTTPSLGR
tara:strand:- start:24 stop:350 length:327 start_codon:yes stop_codon:yes gene_type:complete